LVDSNDIGFYRIDYATATEDTGVPLHGLKDIKLKILKPKILKPKILKPKILKPKIRRHTT